MGRYWGFAYRSRAFTGTHKLLNQISEQGADSYDYSIMYLALPYVGAPA